MRYKIYLAGEIHSAWRSEFEKSELPVDWLSPVTDHAASDACGSGILGPEEQAYWHDYKAARMNAIRVKVMIQHADIVVVKFGEKYRQWNTAYDAGFASALGKALIVIHPESFQHPLKEIDAAANVVTDCSKKALAAIRYIISGPG